MDVIHNFCKAKVKAKTDSSSFLLTNNKGGYLLSGEKPLSRYFGLFFSKGDDVFKSVESINIIKGQGIDEIRNNVFDIETSRGDINERFFMPKDMNSFVYEIDKQTDIEITFDCRKIYDNRQFGRYYSFYHKEGRFVIRFDKKNDSGEGNENGEYNVFVVLDLKPENGLSGVWKKVEYPVDFQRKSQPYERYVYAIRPFKAKRIIVTASTDESEALKENEYVSKNIELLKIKQHGLYQKIEIDKFVKGIKDDKIKLAYCSARNSLDSLMVKNDGDMNLYAGLPWFNQFWTRDTLISLNGIKDDNFTKRIVLSYLKNIGKDGRLPNRIPSTTTGCADGIGWLFLRIRQMNDRKMFSKDEQKAIAQYLELSLKLMIDKYFKNGLVYNEKQETWMDTIYNDDGRPGARIEIQGLTLNMLSLCNKLTKNFKYKKMLDALEIKAFKRFWKDDYFKDGADDDTIRPNVFIAYYAYPKMLSKGEWKKCFDKVIKQCWMPWGGFSTIDKSNPLYQPLYTGENNMSYHRGDSWFWINNLAAMAMYDVDKVKYKDYVNKILSASCDDILFKGVIGHSSELSSSVEQKGEGCFAQAWSAALLIELIEKLNS